MYTLQNTTMYTLFHDNVHIENAFFKYALIFQLLVDHHSRVLRCIAWWSRGCEFNSRMRRLVLFCLNGPERLFSDFLISKMGCNSSVKVTCCEVSREIICVKSTHHAYNFGCLQKNLMDSLYQTKSEKM